MIYNKEHQCVEWKESWRDEYLKWICGYANAYGGRLYVGKSDDGRVKHTDSAELRKLLEDIPNKITNAMGIIADVNLCEEDGEELLEIVVEKYPNLISLHGKYYYRSGSTMREITGKELDRALLKSQGKTWDGMPVPKLTATDLNSTAIQYFISKSVQHGRLSDEDVIISRKMMLENMHLIDDDGYLMRAAMLAFYNDPEKWITGAYIKIGRFGMSDSDLLYQDEIHGPLILQADATIDLIYTKYLKALVDYDGLTRTENYMVHKDAFREILLNAIVHKDYSSCNPIQISVYDDKIYIWNDGKMPANLQSTEDLFAKHSSKPYNPKLAGIFFRGGLIEAWGRGFDKIKTACLANNCPLPEYTITEGGIMVLCNAGSRYLSLAKDIQPVQSEQVMIRSILEFCVEPHSIQEIMTYVGASNRSTFKRKYFDHLVETGMLEMTIKDKPTSSKQKYITSKR